MFEWEKQSLGHDQHQKRNSLSIVLASASPRRRMLLAPFFKLKIIPADLDERQKRGESALRYVKRVSQEKWEFVSERILKSTIVVSADTVVVLDGIVFGKPKNSAHAKAMLRALSNKNHLVMTSVVAGYSQTTLRPLSIVSKTQVGFRKISNEELDHYIRSNGWIGKAGSYAVQGGALSFTSSIVGSLTGVVGLPLKETLDLIEQVRSHPPS